MIGLPAQLSQSEASSLYSWRSRARTQFGVRFLKGTSEEEVGGVGDIKSRKKTKEFAWGVCSDDMGHNCASTSGNFKAISSSSLSFVGGIGGKGRKGDVRSKV